MLKVEGVTISRSGKDLLKKLNFSLNPNSGILISGPNGVGKSSLLAALAGDLEISKGRNLNLVRQFLLKKEHHMFIFFKSSMMFFLGNM